MSIQSVRFRYTRTGKKRGRAVELLASLESAVKKLKSGQLDSETCAKLQQLLCEGAYAASKGANNSQPMNQVFVGGADAIVQEFLQLFTEREGKAATLVICKLLLGTTQDLGLFGTVSQLVAGLGASKIIGRCGRYFLQTCALIDEDEDYHYEDDRPELGKRVQSTGEWVGARFYLDGQTVEVVAYDGDTATYKYEDGTTEVKPARGRMSIQNASETVDVDVDGGGGGGGGVSDPVVNEYRRREARERRKEAVKRKEKAKKERTTMLDGENEYQIQYQQQQEAKERERIERRVRLGTGGCSTRQPSGLVGGRGSGWMRKGKREG